MSTTQRVVRKQLAGAEDLLQGVGIVTQTRGTGSYPIHKLDVPIPTYDIAEMQASSAEFMRLYGTDTAYTDYRRNPEGTIGIPSNLGGVWEPMRSSEYLVCGNFATGAYVFSSDCIVALDQQSYNWQGSVPKVVAPGATPATSGGIGAGAWVDRTDQKLRDDIYKQLTTQEFTGLASDSDLLVFNSVMAASPSGQGVGLFEYSSSSTEDEVVGMIIKPSMVSTGRWKRSEKENLSFYHFGAYGDGTHDDTAAALAWSNWRDSVGKMDANIGSGDFLITGALPFPSNSAMLGNNHDSNIVVGLTDSDSLLAVQSGSYGYSWKIGGIRFTNASGGSLRAKIIDVNGSLRGGELSNVEMWEFSRPVNFAGNIWGMVKIDNLKAYRVSNSLYSGDVCVNLVGNTIFSSSIEIIGAFYKPILISGSAFRLNGFNISGGQSPYGAAGGVYVSGATAGSITSGYIELVDLNGTISNGEAEAIYISGSTGVDVRNITIPTGSVWFDSGSKNSASNIVYSQANGGLRAINNAVVSVSKSALGARNASTDSTKRTWAAPSLIDGNNSGNGLLSYPKNPSAMTEITVTNASFVTKSSDSVNYYSGTSGLSVVTTSANHGVKVSASCVPNKLYTICALVKTSSADLQVFLAQTGNTAVTTNETIYTDRTDGNSTMTWAMISLSGYSTTSTIDFYIRSRLAGTFVIDSVDVYAGASTFDPSQIG